MTDGEDVNNAKDFLGDEPLKGKAAFKEVFSQKGLRFAIAFGLLIIIVSVFAIYRASSNIATSPSVAPAQIDRQTAIAAQRLSTETTETTETDLENHQAQVELFNTQTAEEVNSGRAAVGTHSIPDVEIVSISNPVQDSPALDPMRGLRPIRAEFVAVQSSFIPDERESQYSEEEVRAIANVLSSIRSRTQRDPSAFSVSASRSGDASPSVQDGFGGNSIFDTPEQSGGFGGGEIDDIGFNDQEILIQGMKTVLYTAPIYGVNSDINAPVALEVLSGDFKGSQLLGSFAANELINGFRLDLTRLTLPDGTDVQINGIGLDVDTAYAAVNAEVDRHFLYRYGWWGLGTALSAISTAILADTTVIANDSTVIQSNNLDAGDIALVAAGNLGQEIASTLQSRITRPATYFLGREDKVAVFIIDDVFPERQDEWVIDPNTRERVRTSTVNEIIQNRNEAIEEASRETQSFFEFREDQ